MSELIENPTETGEVETPPQTSHLEEMVTLEPEAEKTIPQSKVEDLIKLNKNIGYEKGYKRAQAELAATNSPRVPEVSSSDPAYDPSSIREMVAEALSEHEESTQARLMQEQQAQMAEKLRTDLLGKIEETRQKHPDFDEVTGKIDYRDFPEILAYANEVPNTGEVILELSRNPLKIGALRNLPPNLAMQEMRKLASSIDTNREAGQLPKTEPPLNSYSSTNTSTGTRKLGLKDYKKMYRV